jgi:hypothetical protein
MNTPTDVRALHAARQNVQAARARLQRAALNSGAWYDARASLNFWESRAALAATHQPPPEHQPCK